MTGLGSLTCRGRLAVVLAVLVVAASTTVLVHAQDILQEEDHPVEAQPSWYLAPAAPSLYQTYEEVPQLHVGVMCIPLWGHFKPLSAIVEELAVRGHHITYFVEKPEWCQAAVQALRSSEKMKIDVDCVVMPARPHLFSADLFRHASAHRRMLSSINDLFEEILRHHDEALADYMEAVRDLHQVQPFTSFLCDLTTFVCPSVARALRVPVAHLYPLTTQLSLGLRQGLPAVGTAFPRHMTLWQTVRSTLIKLVARVRGRLFVRRVNRARAAVGAPALLNAFDLAGMYDTVFAPTVWGIDVPQPLCPNVHPVGPLNTRLDGAVTYKNAERGLLEFLNGCTSGVVYVNFGTLAQVSRSHNTRLAHAFATMPFCVVWKLSDEEQRTVLAVAPALREGTKTGARVWMQPWFDSPMAIMKHPHVFVFVTHCGDTSVMEALSATLPVAGIPVFADQGDVCQRVAESGVGAFIGTQRGFTQADVTNTIWNVVRESGRYSSNLRKYQRIAAALGGPRRAADIIEGRQYNLFIKATHSLETCAALTNEESVATVWSVEDHGLVLLFAVLGALLACGCYFGVARAASWRRGAGVGTRRRTVRVVPRMYTREAE